MRKRQRADYDDYTQPEKFLPSLTVYEPEGGLKRPIGFVQFVRKERVIRPKTKSLKPAKRK
jgi:hypothetical protein